jgi:hypothetical protein
MAWWRKNKRFQCKTGFKKGIFSCNLQRYEEFVALGPDKTFFFNYNTLGNATDMQKSQKL